MLNFRDGGRQFHASQHPKFAHLCRRSLLIINKRNASCDNPARIRENKKTKKMRTHVNARNRLIKLNWGYTRPYREFQQGAERVRCVSWTVSCSQRFLSFYIYHACIYISRHSIQSIGNVSRDSSGTRWTFTFPASCEKQPVSFLAT